MFDSDKELIEACLRKEVAAENHFYRRFAPVAYGICLRYAGNETEAMDIFQNGFIRVYGCLDQFRFEGDFTGWVKQVFITVALNYLRLNKKHRRIVPLSVGKDEPLIDDDILGNLSAKEMLGLIRQLPVNLRTVFNLYVIEEFNHAEIAAMLEIKEAVSRTMLSRAKCAIRNMIQGNGV